MFLNLAPGALRINSEAVWTGSTCRGESIRGRRSTSYDGFI
jgi:hypothetical protein